MKRAIFTFIYLLFVLTLQAQNQVKITSTNLNLRSEPNPKSRIITVIPKGTSVTLTENCDCKWICWKMGIG